MAERVGWVRETEKRGRREIGVLSWARRKDGDRIGQYWGYAVLLVTNLGNDGGDDGDDGDDGRNDE